MGTITPDQAKHIVNLPKHEGRTHLAECLRWNSSDYDEEVNMRGSIHLGYLYDSVEFAASKGFPWGQVCTVLELADKVLRETALKDLELNQAITSFREVIFKYLDRISEKNLQIYTSFVFSTFMTHYKLFRYVFTRPRQPLVNKCTLEVDIPPETFPLQDSKSLNVWEYEQKMGVLEEEEQQRMDSLREQRQALLQKTDPLEQTLDTLPDPTAPLPHEDLTELIKNIAEESTSHTERILQTKVEEKHESLDFYLQRTSLPRPAVLGPPPRTMEPRKLSPKGKPPTRGTGNKTGLSDSKSVKSMRSKSPQKK